MPNAGEVPQIAAELLEMSREYLRQQTIEPAKRLGKHAGMGIGGAFAMAIGAICLAWALYYGLQLLLPEGEWWIVLSRGLTAVGAAGAAGLTVWRMQSGD
jgi:hypothetical protein